jgi:hypothetical protein
LTCGSNGQFTFVLPICIDETQEKEESTTVEEKTGNGGLTNPIVKGGGEVEPKLMKIDLHLTGVIDTKHLKEGQEVNMTGFFLAKK